MKAGVLPSRISTLLLFCAAALLLFARLGDRALLETSEARYAETAREMYLSGDSMTPRYLGVKHYHKPPLTYWITEAGFALWGIGELGARFFLAVAALATLALTAWMGTAMRGPETGLLAAGLLLLSPLFTAFARVLTTDMYLTLACTAAIACYIASAGAVRTGRRTWVLAMWALLGAGFMIKGPVALAIVACAVVPHLVATDRNRWRELRPAAGLLIFACIALPWYVAEALRTPGLLSYWLFFQTVDRLTTTVHGRGGPAYYYVGVLLAGFFPWVLLLPAAVRDAWRGRERIPGGWEWLLAGWTVPPFLLFSLSQSKLIAYILPLFPALAIFLAGWLEAQLREGRLAGRLGRWPGAAAGAVLAAALAWALAAEPHPLVADLTGYLLPAVPALGLWSWASATAGRPSRARRFLAASAAVALIFPALIAPNASVAERHYKTLRPLTDAIRGSSTPDAPVVLCNVTAASLPFYLERPVYTYQLALDLRFEEDLAEQRRRHLERPEELLALLVSGRVFVVGRASALESIDSVYAARTGRRLEPVADSYKFRLMASHGAE